MNTAPVARPRRTAQADFVDALGWIDIIASAFGVLVCGAMVAVFYWVFPVDRLMAQLQALPEFQHFPPLAMTIFSYVDVLSLASLLVWLLSLAIGIGMVTRREWGRIGFVVLLGISGVWSLAGLVLQPYLMSQFPMPADMPPDLRAQFDEMMRNMRYMNYAFSLAFTGLFFWLAWKLCTPAVIAEFRRKPTAET
ncbi:MAG: hypothetical protein ACREVL_00690 [Solimonas sp.]